jgi:hypothetical protein
MTFEIREIPSTLDSNKFNLAQIQTMLQPIIDALPKEEDRDYLNGLMNLMIGKEPRISNIPEELIYVTVDKGANIVMLYDYYLRGLWSIRDIRKRIAQYLNELAVYLSREGDLVKYGFGGYSHAEQIQKVTTEDRTPQKKKGWKFW